MATRKFLVKSSENRSHCHGCFMVGRGQRSSREVDGSWKTLLVKIIVICSHIFLLHCHKGCFIVIGLLLLLSDAAHKELDGN